MKTVVFFRGRATDRIIEDARTAGILCDGDTVIVVCGPGDRMFQDGDVDPREFDAFLDSDAPIVVVANGGPTGPLVIVLTRIVGHATLGMVSEYANWTLHYAFLDIQRDGLSILEWSSDEFLIDLGLAPPAAGDPRGVTVGV